MIPLLAQQAPPEDDIYDIVVLAPKDPVWPIYLGIALLVLLLAAIGFAVWWWLRRSSPCSSSLAEQWSPSSETTASSFDSTDRAMVSGTSHFLAIPPCMPH